MAVLCGPAGTCKLLTGNFHLVHYCDLWLCAEIFNHFHVEVVSEAVGRLSFVLSNLCYQSASLEVFPAHHVVKVCLRRK